MIGTWSQYRQIKNRYREHVLLFRNGDAYEAFENDAETVAGICDRPITGTEVQRGYIVPLAAIPAADADRYIAMITQAGHRVALCEKTGDGPAPR